MSGKEQKYCNCGDHMYDHLKECPFCGGLKISDTEVLTYVLQKTDLDYDKVREEFINTLERSNKVIGSITSGYESR